MRSLLHKLGVWLSAHPFKDRRRAKLLSEPFPSIWYEHLRENVALYSTLPGEQQAHLRDTMRVFIAERRWEGCAGLSITDEMKVTIAAQASMLLLGIEHDYFSQVPTILVYPTSFQAVEARPVGDAAVLETEVAMKGQAWKRGPVILAWEEVLADGRNPGGQNAVIHEFAHQIDFESVWPHGATGEALRALGLRWQEVMTREYHRLVAASDKGRPTLLDHYGATNPTEFFAVATECFFSQPRKLQRRHAQLYDLLRDLYGQDPAETYARQWE
jgi:Mlc titration factor MtfA (ptsG expression regulator)